MKTNHTQFYWLCKDQKISRKKWLPFELICAVKIIPLNRYPVVTQHISWTHLICSVHQEPSRQKVASFWAYMCSIHRLHSNHSLCMSIPKFTDLMYSLNQDPSRQQVAFIWAYMCNGLRVHRNHSLCPSVTKRFAYPARVFLDEK